MRASLAVDLTNNVHALNSTTIDLCMSVFPWAHFRGTKSAVKMHTLLDLRGNMLVTVFVKREFQTAFCGVMTDTMIRALASS